MLRTAIASLFAILIPAAAQTSSPYPNRRAAREGQASTARSQPKRPQPFAPLRYQKTIEQLRESESEEMMARAEAAVKELEKVNENGPWKPAWESLDKHPIPDWFDDAKIGVFIDWGPWSVPGFAQPNPGVGAGATYPDWYECMMFMKPRSMNPANWESLHDYHNQTFGADFRRDDFLPLLTGSELNAEELVRFCRENGARYVIPFSRHHGGWAMWKSDFTHRNAVEMGPKRDIHSEIVKACRKQGLKFGLYFSVLEWEYPIISPDGTLRVRRWDNRDRIGRLDDTFDSVEMNGMCSGKIPVRDYVTQYMMPLFKEAVDASDPDLVWWDGGWSVRAQTTRTLDLGAYFFNRAASKGKEVAINDRFDEFSRDKHGFGTSEHGYRDYVPPLKWEENRPFGHSFGYNWTDNESTVLSARELIHMMVRTVANNGNVLLAICPTGSGYVPEIQKRRFRDIGAWLKVNGEAVYATRVLPPHREGSIYYTRSKDAKFAYATCMQWPGKSLTLKGVRADEGAKITMLGVEQPLAWQQNEQGLAIAIPTALQIEKARPCEHAWAIRISIEPKVLIVHKAFAAPVTLGVLGTYDRVVYTLDGSEPTASSTTYNGPVALPKKGAMVLKARCVRGGKLVGQTACAEFQTTPPKPDVYFDALEPVSFKTGWQGPSVKTWRNVNCHGQPLRVGGETFARGVGMHAKGEAAFAVTPRHQRLVCRVGIDDAAAGGGSAVVRVLLDDKLVCQTPVLTGERGLWNIDAKLEGATDRSVLRIVIGDNNDGIDGDNVDLVDAGFITQR